MRALWFAAGTAAGVYLTARARRAAEALTVEGVHDRLTGWFAGARVLREELLAGMAEKETELRDRLLQHPAPALGTGQAPAALPEGPVPGAVGPLRPHDDRGPAEGAPADRHPDAPHRGDRHEKDDS